MIWPSHGTRTRRYAQLRALRVGWHRLQVWWHRLQVWWHWLIFSKGFLDTGCPQAVFLLAAPQEGFSRQNASCSFILLVACAQAAQRMLSEQWGEHSRKLSRSRGALSGTAARSQELDLLQLELRPVTLDDFMHVLKHMKPSASQAHEYNMVSWAPASRDRSMAMMMLCTAHQRLQHLDETEGSPKGSRNQNAPAHPHMFQGGVRIAGSQMQPPEKSGSFLSRDTETRDTGTHSFFAWRPHDNCFTLSGCSAHVAQPHPAEEQLPLTHYCSSSWHSWQQHTPALNGEGTNNIP